MCLTDFSFEILPMTKSKDDSGHRPVSKEWQEYEHKGHGKGRPKVPEPSTYGIGLLLVMFLVVYLLKRRK